MHLGCMTTLAMGSKGAGSVAGAASVRGQAADNRTMASAQGCAWWFSSSRTALLLQRKLADALARRREDRVRQCGGRDRGARLADPARGFPVPYQVHFDGRRLVDPQRADVVEVGLAHAAVLDRHLAPQGAADPEDD